MNYGQLRDQFSELLNRTDLTDNLADRFIQMGLRRVERLLRTPLQRTVQAITVDNTWDGSHEVPTDYLGIFEIRLNGRRVSRITNTQSANRAGWFISDAKLHFSLPLHEGDEIAVEYYKEFDTAVSDAAVTNYSLVLPDVTIYAALVFAADHFVDTRKAEYENTLTMLIQEVQNMVYLDEMSGGGLSISPVVGGVV